MCHKLSHFIWGIWWFHRSKDFEAMKAGKSAFRPWLSCPYNEHMLVDLLSSVKNPLLLPLYNFPQAHVWLTRLVFKMQSTQLPVTYNENLLQLYDESLLCTNCSSLSNVRFAFNPTSLLCTALVSLNHIRLVIESVIWV